MAVGAGPGYIEAGLNDWMQLQRNEVNYLPSLSDYAVRMSGVPSAALTPQVASMTFPLRQPGSSFA